jgi:two-component system response regulator (stage 0 sporulation protein A)
MVLFVLGFKSNLSGTGYLREAIVQMYDCKTCLICKELYPNIASKFNTTPQRVERCIRHAISTCVDSTTIFRFNDLCGVQVIDKRYSPTNSEFITQICTWLHLVKDSNDDA